MIRGHLDRMMRRRPRAVPRVVKTDDAEKQAVAEKKPTKPAKKAPR